MPTKTISIELDVYERLVTQKQTPRESFSQVLRRARFDSDYGTGASILEYYRKLPKSALATEEELERMEEAQRLDAPPHSKWDSWSIQPF